MKNDVLPVQIRGILPANSGCALFVGNDEKVFVINVEPNMGAVIGMFLRATTKERPLTHDLIQSIFKGFSINVERVVITEMKNSTYFARLILQQQNELGRKIVGIDARPSDCIAIATAHKKPIPAAILLIVIYSVWIRKGFLKKRAKAKGGATGFGDELAGIWNMITASKRTTLMGVLIGIVAGLHILVMKGMQLKFGADNFGQLLTQMGHTADFSMRGTIFDPGYWYITSQEGQLGAWILEKFGWNMQDNIFFGVNNGLPEPWRNPALWMSIGIILGAMVMARLSNEFKFKMPKGELCSLDAVCCD